MNKSLSLIRLIRVKIYKASINLAQSVYIMGIKTALAPSNCVLAECMRVSSVSTIVQKPSSTLNPSGRETRKVYVYPLVIAMPTSARLLQFSATFKVTLLFLHHAHSLYVGDSQLYDDV